MNQVSMLADLSSKELEYWAHVSSQEELPIAEGAVPSAMVAELDMLAEALPGGAEREAITQFLAERLLAEPELVHQLRLLVSVSDKRLYLDLSYTFSRIPHPTKANSTLCGCLPHLLTRHSTTFFVNRLKSEIPDEARASAYTIAQYFVDKGLEDILSVYASLAELKRSIVIRRLILPREYQQNEAKRRGHGAEAEFASLIQALGCEFVPEDKVTNPIGAQDPNVDLRTFTMAPRDPQTTVSFDLVILDEHENIRVCVQGLVQSSDPGQFGVDKSNQTVQIRKRVDEYNQGVPAGRQVQIWGVVDGVGYSENKEGTINKMIRNFHTFAQMKSLYKAALALHQLGLTSLKAIRFDAGFYSEAAVEQMVSRYVPEDIPVIVSEAQIEEGWTAISAGRATIFL